MKFSSLFLATILLMQSSTALSKDVSKALEASYKYCDSMADYAATALKFRQSGKPKELLLILAKNSPEMTLITELAYEFPLVKSPEQSADRSQELSTSQFSELVRLNCREDALKKAKKEIADNNNVTTGAEKVKTPTSRAIEKSSSSETTSSAAEKTKEMDLANNPNKYMIIRHYKDDLDMLLVRKLKTADQSIGIYAFIYATTTGGWKLADKSVLRGTWWPDTQQFYWSQGAVGTQTGCTFWGPEHWSNTFIHKNMKFGEKTISLWTQTGNETPGRRNNSPKSCRKLEINLSCTQAIRCHEWHDDAPGNSGFYLLDNQNDALYLYDFFRKKIRR